MTSSPLVPLARLAAANAVADAFVAVALAGTLFFDVPVGAARGRVALYLLVTMAPFAVVAPVIGPLVDRWRGGRRAAFAATAAGRAALAWAMAGAAGGLGLYPAAFGVLVLSKAYGVTRAAAVPRLLPGHLTLVGANARLSITALVSSTAGGLAAIGVVALAGYHWALRIAALAFAGAVVLALALPARVDGVPVAAGAAVPPGAGREPVRPPRFPAPVRSALLGAVSLRALAGFLTTYLAFLLRARGSGTVGIGVLVAAAALGALGGTALGSALHRQEPRRLVLGSLGVVTAVTALAAVRYSTAAAVGVAAVAAVGGALGKVALDSILQAGLGDEVRGQAFARVETLLQLAWVGGGALGIALPPRGGLGLGVAAAGLAAGAAAAVRAGRTAPSGGATGRRAR